MAAIPSQSAKPAAQDVTQAPPRQVGVALARVGQALVHALQWAALVRTSTSHPLVASPSQSAKPSLQRPTAQRPISQAAAALAAAQALVHEPQRVAAVLRFTSQPLSALPSQSAKPATQVSLQRPITQRLVALGRAPQALPQAPQWTSEARVSVSQPLPGMRSQSPKGSVHMATAQAPMRQAPLPLAAEHAAPHAPQWAMLSTRSTQAPPQQVRRWGKAGRGCSRRRTRCPRRAAPRGTGRWETQATQAGRGGAAARRRRGWRRSPSSARQPSTQVRVAASQWRAAGHVALAGTHSTQRPVSTSQAAPM